MFAIGPGPARGGQGQHRGGQQDAGHGRRRPGEASHVVAQHGDEQDVRPGSSLGQRDGRRELAVTEPSHAVDQKAVHLRHRRDRAADRQQRQGQEVQEQAGEVDRRRHLSFHQARAMPMPPSKASTPSSGQRNSPISTKASPARPIASGRPSGLCLSAGSSLMPVARISPAETAPMPRNASTAIGCRDSCPYRAASPSTMTAGAASMPASAAIAPRSPKKRSPIIIDRLTTLGPGSTCAMASASTNSSLLSQPRRSTSSRWATASTPPKPCKASRVKARNRARSDAGRFNG
mmetsp:Transcript_39182/g.92013  ORF Transcript_39182/g.92013 Transcript_39182/m.92013 type:complete len:291 (+) Transcript_39182:295-1167(+)